MEIPFAQLSFPELYERMLVGPLFRPWAELILDDVELAAGDRVLDIACGTGIVARLAKERLGATGVVAGIDASAPMLAVARAVGAGIDWREGDAGKLPLRDNEQFDVVICQQGLQFFPDKPAAAREMRRALADGGRVAVSTWRSDEELPLLRELRRIAERHVGSVTDRRHSFGEPGAVQALLRDAGFHDVASKTVSRTIRFADGSVFVRMNAMAMAGMSKACEGLGGDERARIVEEIIRDSADVVRAATDEGGFAFEIAATVATATG
jgi:ubiquinone/menaquinone biosynthesis C-methylase UbiE